MQKDYRIWSTGFKKKVKMLNIIFRITACIYSLNIQLSDFKRIYLFVGTFGVYVPTLLVNRRGPIKKRKLKCNLKKEYVSKFLINT